MIQDYDIYLLSKREKICFGMALFGLLCLFSYLFYQNWILLLLLPLVYRKGTALFAFYLGKRRKERLLTEFRDFLFCLSTSFSTGRHMTEAMKEAKAYLEEIYGEDSLMAAETGAMLKAIEETGESEQKSFARFAKRAGLEDIQTFSEVYSACRETGGDLLHGVHKAAGLLSEKIRLEGEIRSLFFQKKLEGRLIAAMPAGMILMMLAMAPGYLESLYTTAAGRVVMTAALACNGAALLWMERMTDVRI